MKIRLLLLSLLSLSLLVSGCAHTEKAAVDPKRAPSTALTRELAFTRSKQISGLSYSLWFGLSGTHEDFQGRAVISFNFTEAGRKLGEDVLIDFLGGKIQSLQIGTSILTADETSALYDGVRIRIPRSKLNTGSNRIEITFNQNFSHTGSGLHRFKDPEDENIYLYTDLEPYNARKVFPCFDQPDLKATFEVTIETPKNWVVVANTKEREVAALDSRLSWAFPPTPIMSTYVFALIAGPYAEWKGDANGIPLRLFARQSLKKYVDAKEWFSVTEKGLSFYAEMFSTPYPFSKYDQILVPDFNQGAMENIAAVTFSERMVFRSKVTKDAYLSRADTILHEMAHMWFGDLVTMRWWNGLWLNESFATFMAALATDRALENKETWNHFHGTKSWAYFEDQQETTHPIEVSVPDTDQAFANFDGITYGKGASVLKQLQFYLGDDDFKEGLFRYFQKFAYRNTTLADFLKMMNAASNKDLTVWEKKWLQSSGVNTLEARFQCDADMKYLDSLSIKQYPDGSSKILRPHKTLIALYRLNKGGLELEKEPLPLLIDGAEAMVRLPQKTHCPDLVFTNDGDYGYFKIKLDPVSLETVKTHFEQIKDPLTRQSLLYTLWEMVIEGDFSALEYRDLVLKVLKKEKKAELVTELTDNLHQSLINVRSISRFLAGSSREEHFKILEHFYQTQFQKSEPGSDLQLIYFQRLLEVVQSDENIAWIKRLIDGKKKISGLSLQPERRWELVRAWVRASKAPVTEKNELIENELKNDPSDLGKKQALTAKAMIPDAAQKSLWWDYFVKTKTELGLTNSELGSAMRGFNQVDQEPLLLTYQSQFLDGLKKIHLNKNEDEQYFKNFIRRLYPANCTDESVKKLDEALTNSNLFHLGVVKGLKILRQEELRCIKIRQRVSKTAGQ